MDRELKDFLEKERVCALTLLTESGECHSAAMHFSHSLEPFQLYFSTDKSSRKGSGLANQPIKAGFVIGFSEEEWKSFQVDGEIRMATESEIPGIKEIHYAKNPGSKRFEGDPNTIFLILQPKWWRYTDFNQKPLKKIEYPELG